ncbi:MAG: prepilin peptidase [Methylobacteriaceae bacterium]|nr:prepilin peptidase [Methylobacteriaceae bacterium]
MQALFGVASLAVLVVLLAAVAFEDVRSHRIPDPLNATVLATGLALSWLMPAPGPLAAMIGVLAGGVFLATVAILFRRLRGVDGLGFGDVKFLAAAGAWVGWHGLPPVVLIASVSALCLAGAQRLARGRFDPQTRMAFGPHLGLATLVVWIAQAFGAATAGVG